MKTWEERNCVICGKSFDPVRSKQLTCSAECSAENRRRKQTEYHKEQAKQPKVEKKSATKSKKQQQKEWAAVIRKCEAAGLSYGEAVAKGVI